MSMFWFSVGILGTYRIIAHSVYLSDLKDKIAKEKKQKVEATSAAYNRSADHIGSIAVRKSNISTASRRVMQKLNRKNHSITRNQK